MTRIIQATSGDHLAHVRRLFLEYAASLSIDLEFQGFSAELASLPGAYAAPAGALLLALDDSDRPVGCAALRPLEPPLIGEFKRLYVTPAGRGAGLGRALAEAVIAAAREVGYRRVRLDTLRSMTAAQRMYEQMGFRDIGPYRYNPAAGARYLELEL